MFIFIFHAFPTRFFEIHTKSLIIQLAAALSRIIFPIKTIDMKFWQFGVSYMYSYLLDTSII